MHKQWLEDRRILGNKLWKSPSVHQLVLVWHLSSTEEISKHVLPVLGEWNCLYLTWVILFFPLLVGTLSSCLWQTPFGFVFMLLVMHSFLLFPFVITRFLSSDKSRTSLSKVCRQKTAERLSINYTITGIDEGARTKRKQKNIFSARINFIAWIIEVNDYQSNI